SAVDGTEWPFGLRAALVIMNHLSLPGLDRCQGNGAMAKKRRKPSERKPKSPRRQGPRREDKAPVFDRRVLEGVMHGFLGDLLGPQEETPLSKAQELMFKAFDSPSTKQRVKLARNALDVSPDC